MDRRSSLDWEQIWADAKAGNVEDIPGSIRVQSYGQLRRIASDYDRPIDMVRSCKVYWGYTGTGKSRRAWEEAGMDAFCKDPRTKFWCGYSGESNVVIDEFRGGIDIAHVLRWLDRYPVRVEVKGGNRPLKAKRYWITSNLDPREWFPDADTTTVEALMRRLEITHFPRPL